jgi:hypothetical protein
MVFQVSRIIIIIIIFIISFMQGIYTHIPETNNVPREFIVATTLLLLFMVPISLVPALALLCFYVSTFQSMCAVPNMVVFCSYYHYYYRISHFSALGGKYSLILGCSNKHD